MKVAVLVIGYNSEPYVERLCASLERAEGIWRVYFWDNGSSDHGYARVKERLPAAVAIRSDVNLGFAAANNRLMRRAVADGADVLFLLNPDTTIAPDAIGRLIAEHRPGRVLQPLILISEDGKPTSRVNTAGNPLHLLGFSYAGGNGLDASTAPSRLTPIAVASGAAFWLPAELYREVGDFDEEFFLYQEDTDLCWRLRLLGAELFLVPSAVVYHEYEFGRNARKYFYVERNRLLMLTKNYSLKALLLLAPFALLTELGLCLHALVHGLLRAKLSAYLSYFSLLPDALRKRSIVQGRRRAADQEIVSRMTGVLAFSEMSGPLVALYNSVSRLYLRLLQKAV